MKQDYIRHSDWRISKSQLTNGLILEKAFHQGSIFSDNIYFVESFLDKLYNRTFSSMLCGGLGLGVAPFMCQSFCDRIDVVEIDSDLIQLINTAGYLSSKINIINDDFFSYTPEHKYDVILADIWQNELGEFNKEVEMVKQKYTPYLNDGGVLYLPIVNLIESPCNC